MIDEIIKNNNFDWVEALFIEYHLILHHVLRANDRALRIVSQNSNKSNGYQNKNLNYKNLINTEITSGYEFVLNKLILDLKNKNLKQKAKMHQKQLTKSSIESDSDISIDATNEMKEEKKCDFSSFLDSGSFIEVFAILNYISHFSCFK